MGARRRLARLAAFLVGVAWCGLPAPGGAQTSVGLVLDGPAARPMVDRADLEREIAAVVGAERGVTFDPSRDRTGDWTLAGVRRAVEAAMADPSVDLVIATGVLGSRVLADLAPAPKPAVAALVPERAAQGFPDDSVAVAGRLYVVAASLSRMPLVTFREVFNVGRVAVVAPDALFEAAPGLPDRLADAAGLEGAFAVGADAGPAAAAAGVPAGADGVYLLPVERWSEADVRTFADSLVRRGLPSFSWNGGAEVDGRILASQIPEGMDSQLPRWLAVTVEALTEARPTGAVSATFLVREQLTLNRDALQAIGAMPRWRSLVDALYVGGPAAPSDAAISIPQVIQEALYANLQLTAAERGVEAGAATVRLARSPLFPRLDLGASTRWMEGNLLESALPYRSTGAFTGSAGLSMPLYDDRTWANYSIEKSLQASREYAYGTDQLDVSREAAVKYLGVLGARTLVEVYRADRELTRSNLEIARIREATGGGRLADVYRWETQLARAEGDLVNATTNVALLEQDLNRLLNRPLTQPVVLTDVAIDDPTSLTEAVRMAPYVDHGDTFDGFRQFLLTEAAEISPELRALDARVAAAERQKTAASRAFWLPSFSLQANGLARFSQWGETRSPGTGELWTVALVGRYPLFTGVSRFAESDRSSRELERIRFERDAARERVDQRVGAAALNLRSALAALEVAREAAEAAHQNYELTEQAYREGIAAIIELLDAQNTTLSADLQAATAAYQLLVSIADLQRALGRFDLFGPSETREAFFGRLDFFLAQAGVEVRQ